MNSLPEYSPQWAMLVNDERSKKMLQLAIENYYQNIAKKCIALNGITVHSEVIDSVVYCQTFSVKYLIDNNHVIRYHIPIDTTNFYAFLEIGIGPEYVSIQDLVDQQNKDRFSMVSASEAVVHNLKMLDEYLAA